MTQGPGNAERVSRPTVYLVGFEVIERDFGNFVSFGAGHAEFPVFPDTSGNDGPAVNRNREHVAFCIIGIIAEETEFARGRPEAVGFITEDFGKASTRIVSNIAHGLTGTPRGKNLHSHLCGRGTVTSGQMSTAHTVSFVMMEGCETLSAALYLCTQPPGPSGHGDGSWARFSFSSPG